MPSSRLPEPPEYRFEDRSWTRPTFTRVWFRPLFRFVPRWLTANFITILGFGATLVMCALVMGAPSMGRGTLALGAFFALQAYVVADHLDGMQALASGTASALGEFLDHFLDGLSGSFMGFVSLFLMPGLAEGVRTSVIALYLLAFIATYQERADARELHFARFGALEGIVVLSVFLLTSGFPAAQTFWDMPLTAGLPGYWFVLAVAYGAFGGTVLVILARMRRVPLPLLGHALVSGLLAWAAAEGAAMGVLDTRIGWALLTLHGADYLARVMQPHLFGGAARADRGAAVMAVVLTLATALPRVPLGPGPLALLALAYLGWRLVASVRAVLRAYGDQWVWVNPTGAE